jgi:exonuclease SbcC
MIPLKLTLQGIYSYQKRETIDFAKLTQSGLFGIFGAVGSGKSTILEAISFVLYGQLERLNQKDRLAYNLMNLKSNELYIDYEFVASRDERRYRFVVRSERKNKRFDEVETPVRSQYRWNGMDWEPVEIRAEEILELSYENFKRTIIIPQGKFQEFLQLGDTERTRMLKEIFNLQAYDLSDKILPLEQANLNDILTTKTNLEQVKDTNDTLILETRQGLKDLSTALQVNLTQLSRLNIQISDLEQIKSLFEEIKAKELIVNNLQVEAQYWQNQENRLQAYETCLYQFKDLLESKKLSAEKINKLEYEIFQKKQLYEQISHNLDLFIKGFSSVKIRFDEREILKVQADDWRKIKQVKQLDSEVQSYTERILKGEGLVKEKQIALAGLQQNLNDLKSGYKELKDELPDLELLNKLTTWFEQRSGFLKAMQTANQDLKIHQSKVDEVWLAKINLTNQYQEYFGDIELSPEISIVDILEEIDLRKSEVELELNGIRDEINQITVKNQLQVFAAGLVEGEPCPLCGSLHHPEILTAEVLHSHLEEANNARLEKETTLRELNNLNTELHKLQSRVEAEEKMMSDLNRRLQTETRNYDTHLSKFVWKDKGFEPDYPEDVEKQQDRAKRVKDKMSLVEAEMENINQQIEINLAEKDKFEKHLTSLEKEKHGKTAELQTTRNQVIILQSELLNPLSSEEIDLKINTLEQSYRQITETYQDLEKKLNSARQEEAGLKSELKIREENLLTEKNNLLSIEAKIEDRMTQSDFRELSMIEDILQQNMDVQTERQKIKDFYQQFNQVKIELDTLHTRAQGKAFAEEDYLDILSQNENLKNVVLEQQKEETRFEEQIKRLESDLIRKQQLIKQLEELELRAADISELKKLFRAEGFVKYVSSVYLQNLSNLANERFYKLTRQRLKLEINENNNFQVRDFLNNGQTRSVKTLSGGQTFQASLSLALALADSIQRFNKSSQNFFFLDEGFGSQDDESLEIVFNTLTALRHENRIVGIISHVEKLQDEIKVYLKIKNDEEEGSSITRSWELEAA